MKKILIIIAVIIALPLVVALFVKKEYNVQREIVIGKSKAEVFEYVKYLKNQDNFSKWAKMDLNMKKSYQGTDGTVGFVSAWESSNPDVGKGEQEIKKIMEGERIDYELRFMEPMSSVAPAFMSMEAVGEGQTKVKWGIIANMSYPMNLIGLFMDMDAALGNDLDIGLKNLKQLMEQN